MKKKMEEITALLEQEQKMNGLTLVLSLLVALLSGVIIGYLLCPKRQKISYMGCGNGCNSGNGRDYSDCCSDQERCCGEQAYCGEERCCEQDVPAQEEGREKGDKKGYIKIG